MVYKKLIPLAKHTYGCRVIQTLLNKCNKQQIDKILQKGKVPIIVGGTGLYVDSLVNGIEYNEIETDLNYREELENIVEQKGLDYLYNKALEIDEKSCRKISQNDKKRIFRILEIYKSTGKTKTELEIESRKNEPKYDFIMFGIKLEREKLYEKINNRVDIMIEQGLIQEVENLCKKYHSFPTAMQGLGYKEIKQYLNGEISREESIDKIKMETRRYAKRQITWFKRNNKIIWLEGELETNLQTILANI